MGVFPVVLDSCVLYPLNLRDVLLQAAGAGLYRVHWSQEILDGAMRNLVTRGLVTQDGADQLQQRMKRAFPQALVEVPDSLVNIMTNHPGDRHVVAAAVRVKAEVIVTFNLSDFRPEHLQDWGVEAQHPDMFLCHLYHQAPRVMIAVVEQQVARRTKPPVTMTEFLAALEKQVPQFVAAVRKNSGT